MSVNGERARGMIYTLIHIDDNDDFDDERCRHCEYHDRMFCLSSWVNGGVTTCIGEIKQCACLCVYAGF